MLFQGYNNTSTQISLDVGNTGGHWHYRCSPNASKSLAVPAGGVTGITSDSKE